MDGIYCRVECGSKLGRWAELVEKMGSGNRAGGLLYFSRLYSTCWEMGIKVGNV
jgi:hypothetical protein